MKFLVDVGVGKITEDLMLQAGYNLITVRKMNPSMHDQKILELSINEERIIITMDKDFGELVYNAGFAMHGILLLRLENMTGLEKGKIVMHILDNFSDKLEGNFCVYHKGRFRVRHKKL